MASKHFEDFALEEVPPNVRRSWIGVGVQRLGQLSVLPQVLVGATLGFGMSFWSACGMITLGTVVLVILALLIGIIGQRSGYHTALLARRYGFGGSGSCLVGLVLTLALLCWFGLQNAAAATGLYVALGVLPMWGWALLFGLLMTVIACAGFRWLAWTAYSILPIFVLLVGYAFIQALHGQHGQVVSDLISAPTSGHAPTPVVGISLMVGSFLLSTITTADLTRYQRSTREVILQTIISIVVGEYCMLLLGVLLAHVAQSTIVSPLITTGTGMLAALIFCTAFVKAGDWYLYSAGLALTGALNAVFGWRPARIVVTLIVGCIGTVLSTLPLLSSLMLVVKILAVVTAPIAGIVIVEYFLSDRLSEARRESVVVGRNKRYFLFGHQIRISARDGGDAAANDSRKWNVVGLIAWVVAAGIGFIVPWGIAAINALLLSMILYALLTLFLRRVSPISHPVKITTAQEGVEV